MSVPESAVALTPALDAGDVERVRAVLGETAERDRRPLRSLIGERLSLAVRDEYAGRNVHAAAALAFVGVETAREIVYWAPALRPLQDLEPEVVAEVLRPRGARLRDAVVRGLLASATGDGWPLLRALVRARVIAPPAGGDYLRLLASGIAATADGGAVREALRRDGALLQDEIWRLLASGAIVAAGSDWAAAWSEALSSLALAGDLDRARLLAATLDCATATSLPEQARWCAGLHEHLGPTAQERLAHLEGYLALVAARSAAAMHAGLVGLRATAANVPPERLGRLLPHVFESGQRTLSAEALGLADDVLARGSARGRGPLFAGIVAALDSPRVEVQERALRVLEGHAGDQLPSSVCAALEARMPTVAAAHADRVAALAGVESAREAQMAQHREAEADLVGRLADLPTDARESVATIVHGARDGSWPAPFVPELTVDALRRLVPRLTPVADSRELNDLLLAALGGEVEPDDVERILDALLRFSSRRPAERSVNPLRRRAQRLVDDVRELGVDLRCDLAVLALAWIDGRAPVERTPRRGVAGLLAKRFERAAERIAAGTPTPLVSFPTHRGGYIDPEVLAGRLAALRDEAANPLDGDVGLARTRSTLFIPEHGLRERVDRGGARATLLSEGAPPRLRYRFVSDELSHRGEPFRAAVAEIGQGPPPWYWPWRREAISLAYDDPLGARYAMLVAPALVQVVFARAAELLALEVDEPAPVTHGARLLGRALDREVPLHAPALPALALALLSRSADVQRVGADVVAATAGDGRLDGAALGAELVAALGKGFGNVQRPVAPLREVARLSDVHQATVWRAVDAVVTALAFEQPSGFHAPLELLHEVSAALGVGPGPEARPLLAQLAADASNASKSGRLSRSLLAIDADDSPRFRAARLAAAATVLERAEETIAVEEPALEIEPSAADDEPPGLADEAAW